MQTEYSRRSPAVKRLMREAQELKEPTEQYSAQPLDDNLFEWHFTVRGPPDSDFANGVYHGRITLPPEYPMKPPSIMLLTPTGRFEVNTKICLSISGHHPETWQPSWSIRTVLLAIIGFMPTKGEGAIGSLDYTSDERKILARKSQDWKCQTCGTPNRSILPPVTSKSVSIQKEAAEVAAQIQFKKEEEKPARDESADKSLPPAAQANQVPAPLPPNPFNMWNPQGAMMPLQAPFMPLPPHFVMPGQLPAGQANLNQQAPANQAQPATVQTTPENVLARSDGVSAGATPSSSAPTASANQSGAANRPASPSATNLRQRPAAAGRTDNTDTQTPLPSTTSQNTAASSRNTQPLARRAQSILCPLVTMTIFSFIIILLLFRRIYITYAYKFT